MPADKPKQKKKWTYEPVPASAQRLFRMAWQIESWLRLFVEIDLRSTFKDWESEVKGCNITWPPNSLENDKKLHHMATPHQAGLSYLTLGELWKIISKDTLWHLFAPYFPPKDNTFARIDEVKAIRNRVAHFREPHANDEDRMALFLKDMEQGVRKFCNRYTVPKYPLEEDPVTALLRKSWDRVGHGVELRTPNNGWLYAPQPHRMSPLANMALDMLTNENYKTGSQEGVIYRLSIHSSLTRNVDVVGFIEQTKKLHGVVLHVIVGMMDQVSVTIPSIIGVDETAEFLAAFIGAGCDAVRYSGHRKFESIKHEVPEYILDTDHVLTFYDDDITQPFLLVS
jgi:hypothetical protein